MSNKSLYHSAAVIALLSATVPIASGAAAQQSSLSGDIQPFRGDINPFAAGGLGGDINPFSTGRGVGGDINPFWGDINPFWGDINPFSRGLGGDINPFWGDINPFSGDLSPFASDISVFWGQTGPEWGSINSAWTALNAANASASQYTTILGRINSLVANAEAVYGTAVTQRTNQTFRTGFANALLAEYGIDLTNPASLSAVSDESRSRFFLDWYDGLQSFSGADQVDHWMATVNWSPAITQDQGEGHDAVVGLIDVAISANDTNIEYLINVGGYQGSANEHGAAVASLIAARHDGVGLMGIAPRATVYAYSPFDNTGTASFSGVSTGITTLTGIGANVINLSLGVPGWALHQNIADILTGPDAQAAASNTVFVIASGNNGITQTQNINWTANADINNILIVGSINPNKQISSFSNSVGETCLLVDNVCNAGYELKNRFLVAPGELILVSDNNGGTTRLSGTSFSAPIVTGAISLLHDRWPWLQQYAKETADIILLTAEDLGAPGVDAVFGHGLLDIAASQSPIDFNNVTFYQPNALGQLTQRTAQQFRASLLVPGQLNLWQNTNARIFGIEDIGRTHRDFTIPLSTLLYEQSTTFQGNTERYQRHVHRRLVDWAEGGNSLASFNDTVSVGGVGDWSVSMIRTPISRFSPETERGVPYHSGLEFTSKDGKTKFSFGEGIGATFLTYDDAFASSAEQDREAGGVNPFLGFASGGMYANFTSEIMPGINLNFGFTEAEDNHSYIDDLTGNRLREFEDISDYQASAVLLGVTYAAADRVTLNATYTRLNEDTGVLGAQGAGVLSLNEGAVTNAMTIGASYDLTSSLTLSASATAGRTASKGNGDFLIGVANDGLTSTAFEFAAESRSILQNNDLLKLKIAQPLYVEAGSLLYRSVQITDRTTGSLGQVDEQIELGGTRRRLISEAEYSMPINNDATLTVFGRMDMGNTESNGVFDSYAGGIRLTTSF